MLKKLRFQSEACVPAWNVECSKVVNWEAVGLSTLFPLRTAVMLAALFPSMHSTLWRVTAMVSHLFYLLRNAAGQKNAPQQFRCKDLRLLSDTEPAAV
jgi:hypothetical protein